MTKLEDEELYGFTHSKQSWNVIKGVDAKSLICKMFLTEWCRFTGKEVDDSYTIVIRKMINNVNEPAILLYVLDEEGSIYFVNITSTNYSPTNIPTELVIPNRESVSYRINVTNRGTNILKVHIWKMQSYEPTEEELSQGNPKHFMSTCGLLVWNDKSKKVDRVESFIINGCVTNDYVYGRPVFPESYYKCAMYLKGADVTVGYSFSHTKDVPFMNYPVVPFQKILEMFVNKHNLE